MDYFLKNNSLKDFLITVLFFLAMAVVIFSFIGVSEAASSNKDVANNGVVSKNFKVKSITISNNTVGGLKGAVEKSKNGDTIYLKKGVYRFNNTNIKINKTLTIVGKGSAKYVVIDARKNGRIFNIAKQGNLKLINVTLKNGFVSKEFSYGGAIYNKGFLSINRCIFIKNIAEYDSIGWGGGIYNEGSLKLESSVFKKCDAYNGGAINCFARYTTYVLNCKFLDCGYSAIQNDVGDAYGSKIIVKGSFFKNCGIENYMDYCQISYNKFQGILPAVIINDAKYNIISHNIIKGSGSSAIDLLRADKNKIHNNNIYGSFDDGISIVGVKNIISKNKLVGKNKNNGIYIYFDNDYFVKTTYSKYNKVIENKIINFRYGIYIEKGFKTNIISYNKLFKNKFGLASSNKFKNKNNIFKGNKKNIIKIKG
jgi:parallel beta-helix repeat protein